MTDLYVIHARNVGSCVFDPQLIYYISSHPVHPKSKAISVKIPNPRHFTVGEDGRILIGWLRYEKLKEELISFIGKDRLLEIDIKGDPECANQEKYIFLTSDEEGKSLCQHFRQYSKESYGPILVIAPYIDVPVKFEFSDLRPRCTSGKPIEKTTCSIM
jgi:hypothetical protein